MKIQTTKQSNSPLLKGGRLVSFKNKLEDAKKEIISRKYLYVMFLPVLIYYIMFRYVPMFGTIIAFKDYNPFVGIADSAWVGLKHFNQFLSSVYFWRLMRNTLMISLLDILIVFPAPIILALMLNEVKNKYFKKTIQTISYLPHFISSVVIVSMLVQFLSPSTGVINNIVEMFGGERIYFLTESKYFWFIYTAMNVWKNIGWNTIIYLAALSGIDSSLYEAAVVDGANRWKQTTNITIPSIMPTIVVLFIMKIGHLLEVGYESIILMYNPQLYETADVISTYVYRVGLIESNYSFATAVGLFQSAIGLMLVVMSNKLSKKTTEVGLW